METEFKFLCDHAQDDGSGKLHAIGIGISRINVQELPAQHPHMCLVVGMRYSTAEAGTKELAVKLIDADGNDAGVDIKGPLPLKEPQNSDHGIANFVLNLNGLNFTQYGDHAFHVTVDGLEVARLPLTVAQPPQTG